MTEKGTVHLSRELLSKLERRSTGANFDDLDAYVELILEEVIHQLDEPEAAVDEESVRDRLESLGYVE